MDDYRGKKCVVLGSNNSAHDICAALWEQDADVTMIQRSSTHVARSDTLMELALGRLYSESAVKAGITTDIADLLFASIPYRIMPTFTFPSIRKSPGEMPTSTSVSHRQGFCWILGMTARGCL